MRYYSLTLSNAQTGQPIAFRSLAGMPTGPTALAGPSMSSSPIKPSTISSLLPNGQTNPAALNIEIDMPQYQAGVGDIRGYVRIWGLGLQDIVQSADYNGAALEVAVGMAAGYPLNNPAQRGVIVKGIVFQAFGNWLGASQTLDLITVSDGVGTQDAPKNVTFTWAKGEWLGDMITRVIKQVAPGMSVDVSGVSPTRIAPQDQPGVYETMTQFAQAIDLATTDIGGGRSGVLLAINGTTARAFEGTPADFPAKGAVIKQLDFTDMVGMPTWSEPFISTTKLVMRGDLAVGDWVKFPDKSPSFITAASLPALGGAPTARNQSSFTGYGQINQIHHWGNFRQPDADAWNTTIWCAMQPTPAAMT